MAYRDVLRSSRQSPALAAPRSERFSHLGSPAPAAGEVESNWITPLRFARTVQDEDVDAAPEWSSRQAQTIYDQHKS